MVRQYIGARYVTKIYENSLDPGSAEWEANVTYEPLTMVTFNYSSYLSKREVPASVGDPATNPHYWVNTGNYNGQIADLQNKVNRLMANMPEFYGAVGDGVADDTAPMRECIEACNELNIHVLLTQKYLISNLELDRDVIFIGGEIDAPLNEYGDTKNVFYSNSDVSIEFRNVKFDGKGTTPDYDHPYTLENMMRFNGCKSVIFEGCEMCNHAQANENEVETAWYKLQVYMINCIDCTKVIFNKCYIHNNHTEQICVGSTNAETDCIITNNRCAFDRGAMALFLIYNLHSCLYDSNEFRDCGRSFINLLSDNVTISNNIMDGTGSRVIASEARSRAKRLRHIKIVNNLLANGNEGGIDSGSDDCLIEGNTILNCKQYAINCSGRLNGDGDDVVTAGLPCDTNTMIDLSDVIIKNNIIKNNANDPNHSRPASIIVRPEANVINNVYSYGKLRNIQIIGNNIEINESDPFNDGIEFFEYGELDNVLIKDNVIKNYSSAAIELSYPSGSNSGVIDSISIINNIFDSIIAALNYSIVTRTQQMVHDIIIKHNVAVKPTARALFGSPQTGKLSGKYIVEDNVTNGSKQTLQDNRLHINGLVGSKPEFYMIQSLNSIPDGLQLCVGDLIMASSPNNNDVAFKVSFDDGTTGTLTGVTGSGSSGSNLLTVNSSSGLKVGDTLKIAGVTGSYIVQAINGNSVYLASTLASTVSAAAVSFKTVGLRNIGTITA